MPIYDLLQEMIDYPNRCILVVLIIQIFFNLTIIPMLIQDIKNNIPESILSVISYSCSFGINVILTMQIVYIADGVSNFVRFIFVLVSFILTLIDIWLVVAAGYKERRK